MDWQAIIDYDKELLLWFNGSQSLFLDSLVRTLTNGFTWVPLYLSLCFVVMRNNETARKILYVIGCAGLCILLAGTIDDEIVKPTVARWRYVGGCRGWISWWQLRILLCACIQHLQPHRLLLVAYAQPAAHLGNGTMVTDQLLDTSLSRCPLPW